MKKHYLLFSLVTTLTILKPFKAKALAVNTQDSLALVSLYNNTDGPNWISNTNWLTISPVANWFGVTVINGRVTQVLLNSNKLKSVIGAINFNAWVNLTNLIVLRLDNNQLTDSLPSKLGNLTQLSILNLSNNQFVGGIPASYLNFSNLDTLDISNNNLTFNGIEPIVSKYHTTGNYANYYPQGKTSLLRRNNIIYTSVGGTPSNNTFKWYKDGNLFATITADSTLPITASGSYNVQATNSVATQLTLSSNTFIVNGDSMILPAKPNIEYANLEYTDTAGWTHYYFNNNTPLDITDDTLLLSLKKNGQNIGTIGDGTFTVKLAATANAGSNTASLITTPLIVNTSGYWVMNRYWQVLPTYQPTSSVGVRFYYNKQDVADVNGSYPLQNLAKDKLIFYTATGGTAQPTTQWADATKAATKNVLSMDTTADFLNVVYIGTSISEGYYASSVDSDWIFRHSNYLSIAGNGYYITPAPTNFNSYPHYGFNINPPTSTDLLNPTGSAFILGTGATLSFTGKYKYVDLITYNDAPSTVTISLNGVVFRTLNIPAGLYYTYNGTQTGGKNQSDNYTITVTSGTLRVSVVQRIADLSAINNIIYQRDAHSGWGTANFIQQLPYVTTQFGLVPNKPVLFNVELSINDIVTQTVAIPVNVFKQNLDTIFNHLLAVPNSRVQYIFGHKTPSVSTYQPIYSDWSAYDSVADIVCKKYGIVKYDFSVDSNFIAPILSPDQLHLSDLGSDYYAKKLVNGMASTYNAKTVANNTFSLVGITKLSNISPNTYSSDSTWTFHALSDSTQYAEFSTPYLSSGGGGATGNKQSILAKTTVVLPIIFINFTGHLYNDIAVLNWQTATEKNADYFNIQRSSDGINFSTIGKVAAAGNSNSLQNYSYNDPLTAQTVTFYYRLKAVDKDGQFTYTNIVALNLKGGKSLNIFPNPVKKTLFAQIQNNKTEQTTIAIIDLQGRKIQTQQVIINAGSNGYSFDVSNLASGSYWMIIGSQKQKILFVKEL